jgi:hypothetical protein
MYIGEATYSGWQGKQIPPERGWTQHCFQALWQYRGISSLATALRIKLMDVLNVPWAWHWFSLLHCQADASRSTHLGYSVGTFPAGSKWFYDTSTGATPGAARCGSFVRNVFSLLVVSSRRTWWTRWFTWFRPIERNTLRLWKNWVVLYSSLPCLRLSFFRSLGSDVCPSLL